MNTAVLLVAPTTLSFQKVPIDKGGLRCSTDSFVKPQVQLESTSHDNLLKASENAVSSKLESFGYQRPMLMVPFRSAIVPLNVLRFQQYSPEILTLVVTNLSSTAVGYNFCLGGHGSDVVIKFAPFVLEETRPEETFSTDISCRCGVSFGVSTFPSLLNLVAQYAVGGPVANDIDSAVVGTSAIGLFNIYGYDICIINMCIFLIAACYPALLIPSHCFHDNDKHLNASNAYCISLFLLLSGFVLSFTLLFLLPKVKGWLDEDLDNYHLKELRCSTQCHTQMSMWIISRGVVLLILLMEYKVLRDFLLHRSSINNSARLSNKFGGFYFSFKFDISGLLHHVITTIAYRIRDKDTSQSKQNLQSSSMTFIHKTLIIPSVLDSCFISSTVSEVKRVMILLYIKICAYDKNFSRGSLLALKCLVWFMKYYANVRRTVADFSHAPLNEYSPSPDDKKQWSLNLLKIGMLVWGEADSETLPKRSI
ncbi:hypothetical protein Tco_0237219 [Tanacetum coccineum]